MTSWKDLKLPSIPTTTITTTIIVESPCNKALEEALVAHRDDLHQGSDRPCPTCQKSAAALGIELVRCPRYGETKKLMEFKKKVAGE